MEKALWVVSNIKTIGYKENDGLDEVNSYLANRWSPPVHMEIEEVLVRPTSSLKKPTNILTSEIIKSIISFSEMKGEYKRNEKGNEFRWS